MDQGTHEALVFLLKYLEINGNAGNVRPPQLSFNSGNDHRETLVAHHLDGATEGVDAYGRSLPSIPTNRRTHKGDRFADGSREARRQLEVGLVIETQTLLSLEECRFRATDVLQGGFDGIGQVFPLQRFAQKTSHLERRRLGNVVLERIGRDHDHRDIRKARKVAQAGNELQSIHVGHQHVADNDVRIRRLLHQAQRSLTVFGLGNGHIEFLGQQGPDQATTGLIILNQ